MKPKVFISNIILIIILNFCLPNFVYSADVQSETEQPTSNFVVEQPKINSEAGFLMEVNSGNILYSKNSDEKLYPASTTKIMTAILTLENCKLDDVATVSQNAVALVPSGYTNAKLVPGEEMSIEDLLYGLMLNSANEAANVLGEHISGTIDEFAKLMNSKAEELGCKNTHFVNTNGMHDENHYTTAEDLAKIAVYCMKNEEFRKIVSTVEYNLPATPLYKNNDRIMKNTNLLINPSSKYFSQYVIGVKTGFTTQAGNCLVSYAEKNGTELVCVTLKAGSSSASSGQRFEDSKKLIEYGLDNFSNQEIIKKNKLVESVEVKNATNKTKYLKIITKDSISDFISNGIDVSKLEGKIDLKDEFSAPISKGQKLGSITYEIDGKEYKTDLVANSSVKRSYLFIYLSISAGVILIVVSLIINFKIRKHNYDKEEEFFKKI